MTVSFHLCKSHKMCKQLKKTKCLYLDVNSHKTFWAKVRSVNNFLLLKFFLDSILSNKNCFSFITKPKKIYFFLFSNRKSILAIRFECLLFFLNFLLLVDFFLMFFSLHFTILKQWPWKCLHLIGEYFGSCWYLWKDLFYIYLYIVLHVHNLFTLIKIHWRLKEKKLRKSWVRLMFNCQKLQQIQLGG